MKRNVVIAIALLVVIFGGGFAVFSMVFGKDAKDAKKPSEAKMTVQVSDAGMEEIRILAGSIVGSVERRVGEDSWVVIAEGDEMKITDEIRTGPAGSAVFDIGKDTAIEVESSTEFGFVEITDAVSEMRLVDGRIAASTAGRKVRIQVKNSDAVAESTDGDFAVLTGGNGNVVVGSQRGEVALSAKGEMVKLAKGTQSTVAPGQAPSSPVEIPSSLFLKVRNPRADATLQTTMVEGTTTPGSVLNIAGSRLIVGDNGKFKQRVALVAGSKDIMVTVEDVTGRKEERSVRVITPNSNTKAMVEW